MLINVMANLFFQFALFRQKNSDRCSLRTLDAFRMVMTDKGTLKKQSHFRWVVALPTSHLLIIIRVINSFHEQFSVIDLIR